MPVPITAALEISCRGLSENVYFWYWNHPLYGATGLFKIGPGGAACTGNYSFRLVFLGAWATTVKKSRLPKKNQPYRSQCSPTTNLSPYVSRAARETANQCVRYSEYGAISIDRRWWDIQLVQDERFLCSTPSRAPPKELGRIYPRTIESHEGGKWNKIAVIHYVYTIAQGENLLVA